MHISRYQILLILCCFAIILVSGCTSNKQEMVSAQTSTPSPEPSITNDIGATWMTIPITDAVTGKKATVEELASLGKPVIMHTFAVWCPACSIQLRESKKLSQNNPGAFTILGVDIDPRENSAQVKNHIEKNQFTGTFVSVPPEFTRSLMETVGDQIVLSLPQTVIICNRTVTYVGDGAFPEKTLETILKQLC